MSNSPKENLRTDNVKIPHSVPLVETNLNATGLPLGTEGHCMPRYFFDTREGDDITRDDVGIDLEGQAGAEGEALQGASEIALEAMKSGLSGPLEVSIRAGSELVAVVRVEWTLKREK